jgi:hypothetical protein
MVANGVGAKNGILFKTAVSLEEAGKVNTVVLDKTGTVTLGNPEVTDIIPYADFSEKELIKIAYSLEKKSEHPLAQAVVKKGEYEKIIPYDVTSFNARAGSGVEGTDDQSALAGIDDAAVAEVPQSIVSHIAFDTVDQTFHTVADRLVHTGNEFGHLSGEVVQIELVACLNEIVHGSVKEFSASDGGAEFFIADDAAQIAAPIPDAGLESLQGAWQLPCIAPGAVFVLQKHRLSRCQLRKHIFIQRIGHIHRTAFPADSGETPELPIITAGHRFGNKFGRKGMARRLACPGQPQIQHRQGL